MDAARSRAEQPCAGVASPGVRTEVALLVALSALALALRATVAWRNPVIFDDGPAFIEIARAMARGDFGSALAHPYHPLYSLLIWLTPGSAGHEEFVGVAWSVLAGTTSVVLLWWMLRPLFAGRVALAAAALFAAHPYAVRISADVQSDTLHLAFLLLGLGGVQRAAARADAGLAFAAGIAAALAYLARPEGFGVVVVGAILFAAAWMQGRLGSARAAMLAGSLGAGFALLAVPYMRIIEVLSGEWQLTQKKSLLTLLGLGQLQALGRPAVALAIGVLGLAAVFAVLVHRRGGMRWRPLRPGMGRLPELAAALAAVAVAALLVSPAAAARYVTLFVSTLRPEISILLVVGLVSSARNAAAATDRAVFFGATTAVHGMATFALLVTAGYLDRRHLLPLAVLLLGYAAVGSYAVADRICRLRTAGFDARARDAVALALVVLCIAIALPKSLRAYRLEAVAAREAAEWIRGVARPGDRVASARPRGAYYAGLVWVPIRPRDGTPPASISGEALRRQGVRFVLATRHDLVGSDAPSLDVVPAAGQRFELVREVERHGYRAAVFEIHEPERGP